MIDESGSYPNRTLAGMAVGLASLLKHQDAEKSTVGLLLPAGAAFVAGFYGTLAAGKDRRADQLPARAPKEVGHVIKDSGVDLVLSIPQLMSRLEGQRA